MPRPLHPSAEAFPGTRWSCARPSGAEMTRLRRAGGQLLRSVRIAHLLEGEAMRGNYRNRRIPDRGSEPQCRPVGRPPAITNRKEPTHEGSHHAVAERIRLYSRDCESTLGTPPLHPDQPADRGRTLPAAAVRREVVLAKQGTGSAVHRSQVERPLMP